MTKKINCQTASSPSQTLMKILLFQKLRRKLSIKLDIFHLRHPPKLAQMKLSQTLLCPLQNLKVEVLMILKMEKFHLHISQSQAHVVSLRLLVTLFMEQKADQGSVDQNKIILNAK